MSEIIRVVPLMAIYNKFEGPTPPKYSHYQAAGDGLQFADGVVHDEVGVNWYTLRSENPGAIKYVNRSLTNRLRPEYYYPHSGARRDATYGFLGVLDPEDTKLIGKEVDYAGEAETVTVKSVMVFCRPLLLGHSLYAEGKTSKEDSERATEHDKPIQGNGSLVVGHEAVLRPLCPDGPQEQNVNRKYGYRDFLVVSQFTIETPGTIMFQPPKTADVIETAIWELQREKNAFGERRTQKFDAKPKRTIEEIYADTPPQASPKLYGRALRRAKKSGRQQ